MGRFLLILTLVLGWAGAALAGEGSSLWPDIPKATGDPHPEGNAYWRKYHPDMLRHDRDLTMHLGDRQVRASLKKCFDCHAARDEAGQVVTYADDRHFCRACHDYAAVKVDCFMCHRSTPEGVDETALQDTARLESLTERIEAYLGRFDLAQGQTEAER